MPTTTGMKGSGYYNKNSDTQRAGIDAYLPWLLDSIKDLPSKFYSQFNSITIIDIGTSEGANSIYALNKIVDKIRQDSNIPLSLIFSDLPTNDYNQLFLNLFPEGTKAFPQNDVFTFADAGNAFKRLAPASSLHIATTYNALGFLETKPSEVIANHILPMSPGSLSENTESYVSEEERAPYKREANKNLTDFYRCRAEELATNGKLLVQIFGRNENVSCSDGIYDVLRDSVLDCIGAGSLPRSFYEALIFPIYFRTVDELIEPIQTVRELAEKFEVERYECKEVDVPFNKELEETGDYTVWASKYTAMLRAFTESIISSTMSSYLSEEDKVSVIDQIYSHVENRLISTPAQYQFRYINIAALLTRK